MRHSASVWLLDGRAADDGALAERTSWLSESERERYAAFTRPQRRRQFLLGRLLLRLAIGARLGIEPAGIRLQERRGNAPLLVFPSNSSVGFSISHSGPWVACAVGNCRLGLDIEIIDPARDVDALAEQAFDSVVFEKFMGLAPRLRMRAFYQLWSEHEARIKLGGEGVCRTLEHAELALVLCSEHALDTLDLAADAHQLVHQLR